MKIMKKLLACLLAGVMLGSLAGCAQVHPMDPVSPTEEEPTTRRERETTPAATEPAQTEPARTDPAETPAVPDPDVAGARVLAAAVYPEWPENPEKNYRPDANGEEWYELRRARYLETNEAESLAKTLAGYYGTLIPQAMQGEENVILSPINIWLALAMLAEVTDTDTRAEILDLMHCADIDECRKQAAEVLTAVYVDDGVSVCRPAGAMFLSDKEEYRSEAFAKLAELYLASAYSGKMGTKEYDQVLRDWVNDNTGHLLENAANGLSMDKDTILALASTIYLKTPWTEEFSAENTEERTFTCEDGTEVKTDFLYSPYDSQWYCVEDGFTAACKTMHGDMEMWFILPEEGTSAADLAADPQVWAFLAGTGERHSTRADVNLCVPRFDLADTLDLSGILQACGVQKVFSASAADFSPITEREDIALTSAVHAARVKIDEEGVEAAAFTVFLAGATAMQERPPMIDFICDRPFLFAVTGPNDIVEFAGMVMTPVEGAGKNG